MNWDKYTAYFNKSGLGLWKYKEYREFDCILFFVTAPILFTELIKQQFMDMPF